MSKIDRQLDLIRFMRNMRMQTAAIIGLLNTNQRMYVRQLSRLIVHESSSEQSNESDSINVNVDPATLNKTFERQLKNMVNSKNKIDKRFIDLHRINIAKRSGI